MTATQDPEGFRLEVLLRHGQGGQVWRARATEGGSEVLLLLREGPFPDGARQVAERLAALALIEVGGMVRARLPAGDGSGAVLVLEGPAADRLSRVRAATSWAEVSTAVGVAGGVLAALHAAGTVHAGPRPEDLMEGPDGEPLLGGTERLPEDGRGPPDDVRWLAGHAARLWAQAFPGRVATGELAALLEAPPSDAAAFARRWGRLPEPPRAPGPADRADQPSGRPPALAGGPRRRVGKAGRGLRSWQGGLWLAVLTPVAVLCSQPAPTAAGFWPARAALAGRQEHAAADWGELLRHLDEQRASALERGSAPLLLAADAPGSPLLRADTALIASGVRVLRAGHHLGSPVLLRAAAGRVVVVVRSLRRARRQVSRTEVVILRWARGRWLLEDASIAAPGQVGSSPG